MTVTDRDNSAVPAVIFNITITKDPITSLNICIDQATEIGQEPLPPPKGAETGPVNKNPESNGGKPFGAPEQPKP